MATKKEGGARRTKNTGRKSKSTFVTKSGQTIKINRSIGDKIKARKAAYMQRRAMRLAGMPKSRVKRFFFRLHPKRLYKYWFSREGGIMALKIIGIGTLAAFLLIVGVFAYFRKDLPNIKDVSGNNLGGSIQYYDRSGQTLLWEDYDAVKRIPVPGDQIADNVKKATVAIEDKDFFKHGGFDVRGITRATINNAVGHNGTQGGSTITQQLVRLTQPGVGQEQTYKRKIKELILSVELEREYSKQDILIGYLNAAPYGGIEYGVEAAARDYFQKPAKDLTLAESAMLASIPKSPTYYSPYNKTDFEKDALIGRQHYVLDLMEQQGMITAQQRDEAKKVDVLATVKPRPQHYAGIQAPWFVLTAKQELERRFTDKAVKRGGWKVITTLDLNAQKIAEDQVNKGMVQVRRQGGDTAGFVAEDVKTGQVVALVGGVDFNNTEYGQNNYAHDLEIPPGSSFKPYDYTALMETQKNSGAGSVLYDTKGAVPGYPCTTGVSRTGNCLVDYDLRYPGPLTLRYALGGSRNVPAIKAMLIAGVDKTIDTAHKLMTNYGDDGKPDPSIGNYKCYSDERSTQQTACYASSAIGDGAYLRLDEHVHGYATLSRNGLNIPQTYIMKVTDASSKTITEWKPSKGVQAVDPQTAYIIDDMISDPNASYLASKPHRYKGWKFGAKTGTTNDSKDGLMMMMSTRYASGVWVGYHNRQKVMSGFMESMTQPIVNGFMKAIHDPLKPEDRVKPAGIQTLPAYVVRSHVGVGSVEPSPSTDLFPSWYKQPGKATGKVQNMDQVSNKLATECTPQRAIKQLNNADSNTFSVDKFVGGGAGGTTTDKDDIHKCSDAKPSISLTRSGNTLVAVVGAGTHPLSSTQFPGTVNFIVDGQVVKSEPVNDGSTTATYTPDLNFDGSKDFSAQVVDSVLYDTTSNVVPMDGSGGSASSPVTLAIPSTSGAGASKLTIFSWSGGTPPYVVYKTGGIVLCTTSSSTCSVNFNSQAPSGTQVYVKDNNGTGTQSNVRTVP